MCMGREGGNRGQDSRDGMRLNAAWCIPNTRLTAITKEEEAALCCFADIRPLKMRGNGSKIGGDDSDMTVGLERVGQAAGEGGLRCGAGYNRSTKRQVHMMGGDVIETYRRGRRGRRRRECGGWG